MADMVRRTWLNGTVTGWLKAVARVTYTGLDLSHLEKR
jgi:hypothetical protein